MKNLIPLFVTVPLLSAFLISLLGKRLKAISDSLSNLATFILSILSLYSVFLVRNSGILVYKVGGWVPPIGIAMVLDSLSVFILVTVNIIAFLVTVYSISYMEKYTHKWKFYTLFLLMLAGMNGIIITGDLFNLFVFLEIASIASYALVAYGTEQEELEAAFKYMVLGSVASSFILLGIAILYSYTSTLNMADMSFVLLDKGLGNVGLFVSVLFLVGFGLKAAIVPFHAWLPDAHPSAPAPISAMLSGLLIKVLGIYALIRILFNVIGISQIILTVFIVLGILSMCIGAFLAIGQSDIKRMLAYSSISQIGYIVSAIGIATPLAIFGALFHLINHAVFKSLLFLNSGAVEYVTGTRNLNKMGGLNSQMPVTGYTSLVGSMSISGIPPFSGFWSKLIIIFAAIQAHRYGLAWVAVIVGVITLAYYLKLQNSTFFGKLQKEIEKIKIKEVPFFMRVSMIVLAIVCVFGGVLLIPAINFNFLDPAVQALMIGKQYAFLVLESIK
jgi:multicomponent Na+:H+ antiporter subunit D